MGGLPQNVLFDRYTECRFVGAPCAVVCSWYREWYFECHERIVVRRGSSIVCFWTLHFLRRTDCGQEEKKGSQEEKGHQKEGHQEEGQEEGHQEEGHQEEGHQEGQKL